MIRLVFSLYQILRLQKSHGKLGNYYQRVYSPPKSDFLFEIHLWFLAIFSGFFKYEQRILGILLHFTRQFFDERRAIHSFEVD